MKMSNLDDNAIRHLIEIHEEAISQLKLQITKRPAEPAPTGETPYPPVVSFYRRTQDFPSDAPIDRPFVAIRYQEANWYVNRGGGAPSGPLTWDALLDWIGVSGWKSIQPMIRENEQKTKVVYVEPKDSGIDID